MKCAHCGQELRFEEGRGWVHQDGLLYAQRLDTDGKTFIDDHCALPVRKT